MSNSLANKIQRFFFDIYYKYINTESEAIFHYLIRNFNSTPCHKENSPPSDFCQNTQNWASTTNNLVSVHSMVLDVSIVSFTMHKE